MTYLLQNVEDSGGRVLQGRSQELENMLAEPFKENRDPLNREDDLPPSAAHLGLRSRLPARRWREAREDEPRRRRACGGLPGRRERDACNERETWRTRDKRTRKKHDIQPVARIGKRRLL